jgi:protein phosphatase
LAHIAAAAARTDVGRKRARNEDALRVDARLGLAVVADGMGGHPSGDVASTVAIEAFVDALVPRLPGPRDGISGSALGAAMAEAVHAADGRVRREALADPSRRDMGTTLTTFALPPGATGALIAHVGDSRAYRLRAGRLEMLTRDHTWVWDEVVAGRLTPDDAWEHPLRNRLTQAIGVDAPVEPDVAEFGARAGDLFLLCSDGLTEMLRDPEVAEVLRRTLPQGMEAAAAALVDEANRLGGRDNITVVLLEVG